MSLAAFLIASFVLAITPGPGVAYVVTRTLAQGRRAGLASVLGVALGNLANGALAALGLALLFDAMPAAVALVKLLGAAYLFYLGASTLRVDDVEAKPLSDASPARLVRDGFLVALLNPKTAIFFAAFLPQFGATDAVSSVALATLFVTIAASTDTGYVLSASVLAARVASDRARRVGRWIPALVYFALAIFAVVR